MTATLKGGADLHAFLATLPDKLEQNVLRGALKAGADVIADGAREECRSAEVSATIGTTSKAEDGLVTAKVQTKGPGAHKAPWLENGTDPHFISVDDEQSDGRTVRRVNKQVKEGRETPSSLMIGGKFVGGTVFHPGARAHPFMCPALDNNEQAAIAAIGQHIAAKLTKEGLSAPVVGDDE